MTVKTRNRPMSKAPRNWNIYTYRDKGWTYQSIADKYGITEGRVRAICKQCEKIQNDKSKFYMKPPPSNNEETYNITGMSREVEDRIANALAKSRSNSQNKEV